MKSLWYTGAGALALATSYHQNGTAIRLDQSVSKRLVLSSGNVVEGLGACSITPNSVACWDMDGASSEGLTSEVRQRLLRATHAPTLSLQYGKKLRYLVVRDDAPAYGLSFIGPEGLWSTSLSNESFPVAPQISANGLLATVGQTGDQWHLVPCEATTRLSGTVIAIVNDWPGSVSVTLANREGARGRLADGEIEIGKTLRPQETYPSSWNLWNIVVGWKGVQRPDGVALVFTAIGRDGKQIQALDWESKPAPVEKLIDWYRRLRNTRSSWPAYMPASFYVTPWSLPDAGLIESNIPPEYVTRIRVTLLRTRKVRITGFPLNPK